MLTRRKKKKDNDNNNDSNANNKRNDNYNYDDDHNDPHNMEQSHTLTVIDDISTNTHKKKLKRANMLIIIKKSVVKIKLKNVKPSLKLKMIII